MPQPTNHLDIDALEWLAEFLRPGNRENKDLTVLLVTHDRFFLEKVCSESKQIREIIPLWVACFWLIFLCVFPFDIHLIPIFICVFAYIFSY